MSMHMHTKTRSQPQAGATDTAPTANQKKRDLQAASVREAKTQADRLIALFATKGVTLRRSEALEGVATLHGERDWNTLRARLEALDSRPEEVSRPDIRDDQEGSIGGEDQERIIDLESADPDAICEDLIKACFAGAESNDMWMSRSAALIRAVVPARLLRSRQEGGAFDLNAIRNSLQGLDALELLKWAHDAAPESQEYRGLTGWFATLPGFSLDDFLAGKPVDPKALDQHNFAALALASGLKHVARQP